ncbi:AlpA family phage regulatory protein [uncultured Sphingopyxis sp.]|jgi:prophage regulatory protein|uniref:helix-turn-helix transcriptional regulator n=1 Tax=uncultured Sphingopyxis sp. TaxID=310581 RepID=UPI000A797313|nr:AlpA family phage regulatory protein [uncultured Sphingopyxis sp.]
MNDLLRVPDVKKASGLARPTIYRDIRRGVFPKPVKIGTVSAWPAAEVAAVNAARIAGKSDDEIRQLVANLHEQRQAAA